jgi:hypothetical protein
MIFIFIPFLLFAFEVEFNDTFTKFIIPQKKAILLNKPIAINYSPKIYIQNGVILLDYEKADEFIRNDFYMPNGVDAKDIKVAIFDIDKFRYEIIKKLLLKYKKCNIKKIYFSNAKKIYLKPTNVKINSKVILECN